MAYIYFAVCALNIILGLAHKQSGLVKFVTFLTIIATMSFVTGGPDIHAYYDDYTPGRFETIIVAEWGYRAVRYFFAAALHADYYMFRLVTVCVCLLLIDSTVKKFGANSCLVYGLYMAYLLFMDTVQVRNFIGEAVIVFSLRYLLIDKRGNSLKYAVCVGIAFLFHAAFVAYLILLVCKLKNKRKIADYTLAFCLVMFVVFFFFRAPLAAAVDAVSNLIRHNTSYSTTVTRWSALPYAIVLGSPLFVLQSKSKRLPAGSMDKTDSALFSNGIVSLKLMSIFIVTLLLNINFYRIVRNMIFIVMIAAVRLYELLKKSKRRGRRFIALYMLLFVAAMSVLDYGIVNAGANIVWNVLDNNLLINNVAFGTVIPMAGKICVAVVAAFLLCLGKGAKRYRIVRQGGVGALAR